MSQLFASGDRSIGVSASTSVLPMLRTDLLYDGLVGSPCSPRDSQESSPTRQFKASILRRSASFLVQLSHPYMTTGKTLVLTRWTFVDKVISLLFNMLSKESEVSQSCLTLCDPVDSSLPGSCVHRILQARILE